MTQCYTQHRRTSRTEQEAQEIRRKIFSISLYETKPDTTPRKLKGERTVSSTNSAGTNGTSTSKRITGLQPQTTDEN